MRKTSLSGRVNGTALARSVPPASAQRRPDCLTMRPVGGGVAATLTGIPGSGMPPVVCAAVSSMLAEPLPDWKMAA